MPEQELEEKTTKKKRTSAATIIGWFFAILCFLTGFTLLFTKPLAGFLYILAGAVVFPPFWNMAKERNWKYIPPTILKIAMFILFLGIGGAVSGATNTQSTPSSQPTATAQNSSTPTATDTPEPTATPTQAPKGLDISRDEIIEKIQKANSSIEFKQGNDSNGQENYVAQDGQNIMQLLGPGNDLTQINSMALMDSEHTGGNLLALTYILGIPNVIDTQAGKWASDTMQQIDNDLQNGKTTSKYSKIINGRKYTMELSVNNSFSFVSLAIDPAK